MIARPRSRALFACVLAVLLPLAGCGTDPADPTATTAAINALPGVTVEDISGGQDGLDGYVVFVTATSDSSEQQVNDDRVFAILEAVWTTWPESIDVVKAEVLGPDVGSGSSAVRNDDDLTAELGPQPAS